MKKNKGTALAAMEKAQKITFYPIVFQATVAAKRLGILDFLSNNKGYSSPEKISNALSVSTYGVKLLLDMLCQIDIVKRNSDDNFSLDDTGYFILHDTQTSINLDFVHDVCYKGAFHLTESIKDGKPRGLNELGNWGTIYEGLLDLPEKVQDSWFNFDHFYSDMIFTNSLKFVFSSNPSSIMDIGGNTGKFAIEACRYNKDIHVTIVDLEKQLKVSRENVLNAGLDDRVDFCYKNMLQKNLELPKEKDIIWMSQFLDCFSEEEIIHILDALAKSCNNDTRILIIETFWDNQKFNTAEYCLLGTSLYFTFLANGNSRMYSENDFRKIISRTNFKIVNQESIVEYHTLLELKLKA